MAVDRHPHAMRSEIDAMPVPGDCAKMRLTEPGEIAEAVTYLTRIGFSVAEIEAFLVRQFYVDLDALAGLTRKLN